MYLLNYYLQFEALVVENGNFWQLHSHSFALCVLYSFQLLQGCNALRFMGLISIGLKRFPTVLYTLMEIPCSLRISLMTIIIQYTDKYTTI